MGKRFIFYREPRGLTACLIMLMIGAGTSESVFGQGIKFNVADFGAVTGDGYDDSEAIAAALASAESGDTLFFPPGTYLTSSAMNPKSGIVVLGSTVGDSVIRFVGASTDNIVRIREGIDIEIGHLVLDGNHNPSAENGIRASAATGVYLHHLKIRNLVATGHFGPHGIYFSRDVTDSTIADNVIESIAPVHEWGAGIRMAHRSSRNRVLRNMISDTGRGGIFANDGSTDLVIRHNIVSGSNGPGLGIELWTGCDRALIEDNTIDHWLSLDRAEYTAVRRNVISDRSGIYKFTGLELAGGMYNVFTDNRVDGGAKVGISVSNASEKKYNFWGYNTVRNAGRWGAQIQGETSGAWHLYFYRNRFIENGRDHLENRLSDQGHGFRVNGNTFFLTLEENEFRENEGIGLQFTGRNLDQISITRNVFQGNTGHSVTPVPESTVLEWTNNSVTDNGTDIQLSSRGLGHPRPSAGLQSESLVVAGQAVAFSSASSDGAGGIRQVLWDFGDGIPSTEPDPTHVYKSAGSYRVTLIVWDNRGRGARSEATIIVQDDSQIYSVDMADETTVSNQLVLLPNYPNPFIPRTEIRFRVPSNGTATVTVHDILGREVAVLFSEMAFPGSTYRVTFEGGSTSPGVYFYTLSQAGRRITRPMLHAK